MPRINIMLAHPYEEKRIAKWPRPFLVQPKLDGDRCLAYWDGASVTLKSSQDNEIVSVPHINEALRRILDAGRVQTRVFDGELYTPGLSHNIISGICRSKHTRHPRAPDLQYHIYDVHSALPNAERVVCLEHIFRDDTGSIKLVPTCSARTEEEAFDLLREYMENGFEGIIFRNPAGFYIKHRSHALLKFKPTKSDTYKIVGTEEERDKYGEPKGTLGSFLLKTPGEETFSCGSGLTALQRRELWQRRDTLPGARVHLKYQELSTDRKVPRFPIFLDVIPIFEVAV